MGRPELGMLPFKFSQLGEHGVIELVRNLRRIQRMIEAVMALKLPYQRIHALADSFVFWVRLLSGCGPQKGIWFGRHKHRVLLIAAKTDVVLRAQFYPKAPAHSTAHYRNRQGSKMPKGYAGKRGQKQQEEPGYRPDPAIA